MAVGGVRSELSRADLRRAQVIEAAHKCFAREGFHTASMASIAAEAGLSVGQIYRYFENKEAVIEALCEGHLETWTQRMAEVRARTDSVTEELLEVARFNTEKLKEGGSVSLVLEFFAEAARNPRIGEVVSRVDGSMRQKVREILARGGDADPACLDARVNVVTVLLDGWLLRLVKDPEADAEAYLTSLRPMFEVLASDKQ